MRTILALTLTLGTLGFSIYKNKRDAKYKVSKYEMENAIEVEAEEI